MIATVTTCPRRWREYRRLRQRYAALGMSAPLRTFQTAEALHDPRVNNNLNARAALKYAANRLAGRPDGWLLYLEDDLVLSDQLPERLPWLMEVAESEKVDCVYLCNRKNPVRRRLVRGDVCFNELADPILGTHALLLPGRHLPRLLRAEWSRYADEVVFRAFRRIKARIWQVLDPVLIEHVGEYSTYDPLTKRKLEINHANSSNSHPA